MRSSWAGPRVRPVQPPPQSASQPVRLGRSSRPCRALPKNVDPTNRSRKTATSRSHTVPPSPPMRVCRSGGRHIVTLAKYIGAPETGLLTRVVRPCPPGRTGIESPSRRGLLSVNKPVPREALINPEFMPQVVFFHGHPE